ncbi:hypothetical protein [Deinococcus pimensis]|uniref:hypothetical protein n=1 Tax=Deinococcus pimensis TaxID=309888 RepID=UPI0005EB789F|nr:hypothetical protein [Deinococcus pimensis]
MNLKPLGRRGHALVDWVTAPALLLLARHARLSGPSERWAHVFAGLILLAVSTTRTPLGIVRVVPFRLHGHAEIASVIVQAALPWLAGFSRDTRGRRFFLVFAAYNLLVWLLTDFRAPEPVGEVSGPRART